MTDSPDPALQYLSNISLTVADHCFVLLHSRNKGYWYNYSYNVEELKPWADKVNKIVNDPELKWLRVYFNNHYGGKAGENALQFMEMTGSQKLSQKQQEAKNRVREALEKVKSRARLAEFG